MVAHMEKERKKRKETKTSKETENYRQDFDFLAERLGKFDRVCSTCQTRDLCLLHHSQKIEFLNRHLHCKISSFATESGSACLDLAIQVVRKYW